MGSALQLISERISVPDSLEEINSLFYERSWTDGLPIIPPTEARVERMLSGTTRKPEDLIGAVVVVCFLSLVFAFLLGLMDSVIGIVIRWFIR